MEYAEAMEHTPTRAEAVRELTRHGSEWADLVAYCDEYGLDWSAPGVLLGFLGY